MGILGLALQLLGACLAIIGLHQSKRQLFPNMDDRGMVRGGVWGVRHLHNAGALVRERLRRPGPHQTWVGSTASLKIGPSIQAVTHVEYDNPTMEQRVATLEQRLGNLESLNQVQHELIQAEAERQERMRQRLLQRVSEMQRELHHYAAQAVGGSDGHGLDLAACGVLVAAVGTVVAYWG